MTPPRILCSWTFVLYCRPAQNAHIPPYFLAVDTRRRTQTNISHPGGIEKRSVFHRAGRARRVIPIKWVLI